MNFPLVSHAVPYISLPVQLNNAAINRIQTHTHLVFTLVCCSDEQLKADVTPADEDIFLYGATRPIKIRLAIFVRATKLAPNTDGTIVNLHEERKEIVKYC